MSAIRAALHQCADLIADALEEDMRGPGPAKIVRKRRKRESPGVVPLPPTDRPIDEVTRARAVAAMRRAGLL